MSQTERFPFLKLLKRLNIYWYLTKNMLEHGYRIILLHLFSPHLLLLVTVYSVSGLTHVKQAPLLQSLSFYWQKLTQPGTTTFSLHYMRSLSDAHSWNIYIFLIAFSPSLNSMPPIVTLNIQKNGLCVSPYLVVAAAVGLSVSLSLYVEDFCIYFRFSCKFSAACCLQEAIHKVQSWALPCGFVMCCWHLLCISVGISQYIHTQNFTLTATQHCGSK